MEILESERITVNPRREKNSTAVFPKEEQSTMGVASNSVEVASGTVAWSKASVLKLIQLHKEHQYLFDDPHYKKKSVWEMVAVDMQKEGLNYTWQQAENKWKSLTKKYRDTVDFNAKCGHICPQRCPFYTELSLVYKYTPQVTNQGALASSVSETSETNCKAVIGKKNHVHQRIVAVVSQLPHKTSVGLKRSLEETNTNAGASFPAASSPPEAEVLTKNRNILMKKKKYNNNRPSVDKESDINQVLHMLHVINDDRKKQERLRMEKLEKMHMEKMTMFKEVLAVLKTSVDRSKTTECRCTCGSLASSSSSKS